MYYNDVHILFYVGAVILGGLLGQFMDYCSKCFIKKDKIFSKKKILYPVSYGTITGQKRYPHGNDTATTR